MSAPEVRTPWWDLVNLAAGDIAALVDGTGWIVEQQMEEGSDHVVVLRRVA